MKKKQDFFCICQSEDCEGCCVCRAYLLEFGSALHDNRCLQALYFTPNFWAHYTGQSHFGAIPVHVYDHLATGIHLPLENLSLQKNLSLKILCTTFTMKKISYKIVFPEAFNCISVVEIII